jgi:hypothetical protein
MRRLITFLAFSLVVASCNGDSGSTPVVTGSEPGGDVVVGDTAPPETPPPPPTCPATTPFIATPGADDPYIEFVSSGDPGLASVTISQAAFECATDVVAVGSSDPNRIAVAAVLAADLGAPLLVGSPATISLLTFEIERLAPERLVAVGDDLAVTVPEWTEVDVIEGDTLAIAIEVNSRLGATSSLPLPETIGLSTLVAAFNAIGANTGLLPPTPPTTTTTTTTAESTTTTMTPISEREPEPEDVPGLTAGTGTSGVAILVDGNDTAAALAALATATSSGAVVSLIDERDLRRVPDAGRALQGSAAPIGAIHVLADVTNDARWQLDVIRTADELPGGGFLILPRRYVALYGNPVTSALGVLGEQGSGADGARASAARIRDIAAPFEAGDLPVQPAFEIIATVAAAEAGADGDYSNEFGADIIQPWIDVAAEEDVYVILDLQPGRDDFLSQAMEYEEFLLNPHVGLALDPEWRLEPDQVHLRQIGRVEAAEVQQVIEWLADLVRENDLPQKMLLLHQFRFFMLENRETIQPRPELQIIIQMDGQGAVSDKYATWNALTEGWETHPWAWGWKNFYDEDSPGPIPASEVFELVPTAVLVSYQ